MVSDPNHAKTPVQYVDTDLRTKEVISVRHQRNFEIGCEMKREVVLMPSGGYDEDHEELPPGGVTLGAPVV
jgi:hypothetical protein